ncbi:restriction endonuclease subunit S [Neisseria subflava]|uniref:restriction endonuclease subunit S n=1 Tax=Neisseria subflava TaxID=28449 RepID=UPI002029CDA1|nr:restriction endonuclease subunit S [Neisseria subflava]
MNKQQEPRLRFKVFSGAWKEKKIGEILSEVRRSIYLEDSEKYQLVTVKRRNEGVVSRGYLFGKDILVKNYSQLKTNDYLISKRQIIHGANGIIPSELDNAIVSNEYLVVVSNNDVRTEFLTLVSRTPSMYRKFLLSSYGVDIEKMVFNVEDWKGREITLPSLPEQTHLGLFFRRLDSQITESRAVLEKSRQLKKAMLAKMFPANGEKIPKIRFKGFEGEWEWKKLGEIGELYQPRTITGTDLTFTGYPVFGANGYIGFYGEANHFEDQVTISARGEGTGTANYVTAPVWITGNSMVINVDCNNEIDKNFLFALLTAMSLKKYVTGGAQPQLTREVLEKISLKIPTLPEQTAIGNFFRQLDETITLQSAEIEKLNQLKKGLLAAMLV